MAIEAASVVIRITADSSQFDSTVTQVKQDTRNLGTSVGQSFQTAGRNVGQFGRAVTSLSAPLAGVFTFAIAKAVNFEDAFANVEKTVDGSEEQLADLRRTLRQMATDSDNPLSALDNAAVTLAEIAAIGGQLGIGIDDLDDFTLSVGALTVATDLSAESASFFLGRMRSLTDLEPEGFDGFSSALVTLGNNMAATESEIAGVALEIAAAGDQFGLTEGEILAVAGAMAALGIAPEKARSAFADFTTTIIEAVATGDERLTLLADVAGVTTDAFKEMVANDPFSAIDAVLDGLAEKDPEEQLAWLKAMGLDGQRVADVMLRLANGEDTLSIAMDLVNEGLLNQNAHMTEAEKKADTTKGAINRLKNQIDDMAVSIGDTLTPAIQDLTAEMGPLTEQIGDFAEDNETVTAAVGLTTFGLLALGIAGAGLGVVIGGLTTIVGGFVAVITSTVGIIVGIAIGVAILTFALLGMAFGFENVVAKIEELTGLDLSGFKPLILVLDVVRKLILDTLDGITDIPNKLKDITSLQVDLGNLTGAFQPLLDQVSSIYNTITDIINKLPGIGGGGGGGGSSSGGGGGSSYDPFHPPANNAAGGPMTAGMMSLVGEQGPELFVPSSNGRILNNSMSRNLLSGGGGGGQTVVYNISNLVLMGVQNVDQMRKELERSAMRSSTSGLQLKGVA